MTPPPETPGHHVFAPMSREARLRVWLVALVVALVAIWLLRSILLPFVAGMAIAYFLDPLANRLERMGLSRIWATVVITLTFFLIVLAVIVFLAPIIGEQVAGFAQRVPGYVQALAHRADPIWRMIKTSLTPHDIEQIRTAAGDYAGTVAGWAGSLAKELVGGSIAIANALSLVFITPIVTFYMLRDWHRVTALVNGWLPPRHADFIHREVKEIDHILAGFVRGQALVCLSLAIIYGAGLTLVGLDLGLVVGIGAGLLSFVPYLGSISGFVVSMGLATAQGNGWVLPAEVAVVYVIGNQIEANFLAPRLVGRKIGLHPVWVIFALLAGGALFGFLGLLLALPSAAVIGVLARAGIHRYLESPLYTGDSSDDPPAAEAKPNAER
jgi:predicted PurR-regulated permease PerM